jgi:Ni/Co efflux regulator RcnB
MRTLVLLVAATLAAGPALAEKPAWAGGGKDVQQERKGKGDSRKGDARGPATHAPRGGGSGGSGGSGGGGGGVSVSVFFGDHHRTAVHDYFARQSRSGSCPPGLAKKGNGCMPPGQAKKWSVGRALPRDVIFYDLPPAILVELGPPPAGHRFVRVAADILLIAVGTSMVVDAIEDLGGL